MAKTIKQQTYTWYYQTIKLLKFSACQTFLAMNLKNPLNPVYAIGFVVRVKKAKKKRDFIPIGIGMARKHSPDRSG